MKSNFRIEYDFDQQEPIIRIIVEHDSDDMRDRMLSHFFQMVQFPQSNNKLGLVYEDSPDRSAGKTKSVIKLFPIGSKTEAVTYPQKEQL